MRFPFVATGIVVAAEASAALGFPLLDKRGQNQLAAILTGLRAALAERAQKGLAVGSHRLPRHITWATVPSN